MFQPYRTIHFLLVVLLSPLPVSGHGTAETRSAVQVPLTRTLKLPVRQAGSRDATPADAGSPSLGIWPGAEDELPEGPTSFEVLPDGSLAVADPLSQRIAVYDATGTFTRAWNLGFFADSITAVQGNLLLIRDQKTGEVQVFNLEGKQQREAHPHAPIPLTAKTERGSNRGSVSPGGLAGSGNGQISVVYDQPRSALVAIEPIASAQERDVFVALETTAPQGTVEGIDVRKLVRRYSLEGQLLAESSWLPLDYFVPPVDELRVHNGVLYQLATTRTEVHINEWDMNAK